MKSPSPPAETREATNRVEEADASAGELPPQVAGIAGGFSPRSHNRIHAHQVVFECGPYTENEQDVIRRMKLAVGDDVLAKASASSLLVRHLRGQRKKVRPHLTNAQSSSPNEPPNKVQSGSRELTV